MTGPARGPIVQIVRAVPRLAGGIMSAIKPPPRVIATQPIKPARKRKMMSIPTFTLTPQMTVNMTNPMLVIWVIGARPYCSPNGVKNRGPKMKATMKTETRKEPSDLLVTLKSAIVCGTAGAKIVGAIELHSMIC